MPTLVINSCTKQVYWILTWLQRYDKLTLCKSISKSILKKMDDDYILTI